ncbi:MAG: NUDIX hydrolase [Paracoccaceae bacterium]
MTEPKIMDAATLILVRDAETTPAVLMGQRGAKAAFMPNKFVFPGGAVDAGDHQIKLSGQISSVCKHRLETDFPKGTANAIIVAAIRELWEEAGLILGTKGHWDTNVPDDWRSFAKDGYVPSANGIHFIFRAITPPGRPRRFDARFLLADASRILGDPDDFAKASDELSNLQWIPVKDARNFNLPFITEVVLAEVAASLPKITAPDTIPFFNNDDEKNLFERIKGKSLSGDE